MKYLLLLLLCATLSMEIAWAEPTVLFPQNITPLTSGENITLQASIPGNYNATYSLDNGTNTTFQGNFTGIHTNFTSQLGGILANGGHVIIINAWNATNSSRLEHPFNIQDVYAPEIAISPAINNTETKTSTVNITASEIANITYRLGGQSGWVMANKSANISISPAQGQNFLDINATDFHGNTKQYRLNFTYATGTCTDAEKNYHDGQNETGIDCGGPCSPCVTLAISTDKETYGMGELVYANVQARADSRHNITIKGPGYHVSFAYNGSTYYILTPPSVGTYTINVTLPYRNLTPQQATKQFQVASTGISLSIIKNASTISVGDVVEYKYSATGNSSGLSIKWDLNGDGTVDSTQHTVNYTYNSPGSYTATLNATDTYGTSTTSSTMTVLPKYNVTITIKNIDNQSIPGAEAILNDELKAANPDAGFQARTGTYGLAARAPGYINKTLTVSISENQSYSYILYRNDNVAPIINLMEPGEGYISALKNITAKFSIIDESINFCVATIKGEGSTYQDRATVRDGSTQTIQLIMPGNGTYQWAIVCTDERGNSNTSLTRTLAVQIGEEIAQTNLSEYELMGQLITNDVTATIAKFEGYGKDEQEAMAAMQIISSLERAKSEVARILRDVRNVKWRKFNQSEENEFLAEKMRALESLSDNITMEISIEKSNRFVAYPYKNDIKEAAEAYLKSQDIRFTQKDITKYLEQSKELQQSAVITTAYKLLTITLRSGVQKEITLVEKTLDINQSLEGAVLLETIPKTMAASAKELRMLFEHEIVLDDPVISVELPDNKKYAYYIEKEIPQSEVQKTTTVLLKREFEPAKETGITGFAIFSEGEGGSAKARLAAEIVVALILAIVYFSIGRTSKEQKKLNELIAKLESSIQNGTYENSKKLYAEASAAFKTLKGKKKSIYAAITELRLRIDAQYVKELAALAKSEISKGDRKEAKVTYEKLCGVYKTLPADHKKSILKICQELHQELAK